MKPISKEQRAKRVTFAAEPHSPLMHLFISIGMLILEYGEQVLQQIQMGLSENQCICYITQFCSDVKSLTLFEDILTKTSTLVCVFAERTMKINHQIYKNSLKRIKHIRRFNKKHKK